MHDSWEIAEIRILVFWQVIDQSGNIYYRASTLLLFLQNKWIMFEVFE